MKKPVDKTREIAPKGAQSHSESTPAAIRIWNLKKVFGTTIAVNGIDLEIPQGIVYGFLGPNGAGKTTTIRMLATLLQPDGGRAEILGHDLIREANEVRKRVSLTGQFASVDEDLSGLENLVLIARLLGFRRREARVRSRQLLEAFGLQDASSRQVKTYSGGMRRRLDIAASIVVTPDILFLDEPTTGLDPRSRNQVWSIIRALVREGTTVLLTTQYLDEADQLADRIAVIDHGSIIAEGTSDQLKARVGSGQLNLRLKEPDHRESVLQLLKSRFRNNVEPGEDPHALRIQVDEAVQAAEVVSLLVKEEFPLEGFSLGRPSLDEVFLKLTSEPPGSSH